jgi:HSP20 family protein
MTLPTRWNPFQKIARIDPFLDFEELIRGFNAPALARDYERVMDMKLDVTEDEKQYLVNVDIPGVKKENIDISLTDHQVGIRAEVKREESREKGKEIYSERYSGEAYRTFTLPAEIDSEKAEANYDGGVLTLKLPKKAGNSSKRLSIK